MEGYEGHNERAQRLLLQMTIAEKIAQLHAVWVCIKEGQPLRFREIGGGVSEQSDIDPWTLMKDGIGQITRPLGSQPIQARQGVRELNKIQKYLVEKTRLGIPALPHEECLAGLMVHGATIFPAAINYASLWDETLVQSIGTAIGKELGAVGSYQGLAPVLDVARDARWGRTEETLGEDPYLVGCLASAYVNGFQGKGRQRLATLKHYAGHSFSEGARNHAPVRVGIREFNDIFLLPFEMAVKLANVGSIMPAYHDVDGEPSSSSFYYLTEVLRRQWGFDGLIVSDYMAINLLYEHHKVAETAAEAAALAVHAGMDQELPGHDCYRKGILKALEQGILEPSEVDAAVLRVLKEKSRLGLFEHPYADEDAVVILNSPDHASLAQEAAEKSLVLLKNDGILPLKDEGTTAVIGPLAEETLAMLSGYTFPAHMIKDILDAGFKPIVLPTILQALKLRAKVGKVTIQKGCDLFSKDSHEGSVVFPGDVDNGVSKPINRLSSDTSQIAAAVQSARTADRVILVLGDRAGLFQQGTVGEGCDASSLSLPGVQQQLFEAVLAVGKPTVLVLSSGRPYVLGPSANQLSALVAAWLPGQGGAEAIAKVIYGEVNPSGRTPISFPRSIGAMPYFYNHKHKSGGTPTQLEFGAIYPFGYGLSYTTFQYSDFRFTNTTIPIQSEIHFSFKVTNTGPRTGDEIAQVYIRDRKASLVRPIRELKGFKRLHLDAGKSCRVECMIPVDLLHFTIKNTIRIVEPGEFDIIIGRSAEDTQHSQRILVTGTTRTLPQKWRMQSVLTIVP